MNGEGVIHPGLQPLPYTRKWLFWVTAFFSVIYVSYSTSVVAFARLNGFFPLPRTAKVSPIRPVMVELKISSAGTPGVSSIQR